MFQQTTTGAPEPAAEGPRLSVRFGGYKSTAEKCAALGRMIGTLCADEYRRAGFVSDTEVQVHSITVASIMSPQLLAVIENAFDAAMDDVDPSELQPEASESDVQLRRCAIRSAVRRLVGYCAARDFVAEAREYAAGDKAGPPPQLREHCLNYSALIEHYGREIVAAIDPETDVGKAVAAARDASAQLKAQSDAEARERWEQTRQEISEGYAKAAAAAGAEVTEVIERDAQGEIVKLVKRRATALDFMPKPAATPAK